MQNCVNVYLPYFKCFPRKYLKYGIFAHIKEKKKINPVQILHKILVEKRTVKLYNNIIESAFRKLFGDIKLQISCTRRDLFEEETVYKHSGIDCSRVGSYKSDRSMSFCEPRS